MFGLGQKDSPLEKSMRETELIGTMLKYNLEHGKVDYNDEEVQLFLPVTLSLIDFDWLRIIAENTVPAKDCMVFDEVLTKIEVISKQNAQQLMERVL